MHVHVRVSERERESVKKTRERTTKSELAQVNVQLSRLHRVCCVYVWLCLYMCVCPYDDADLLLFLPSAQTVRLKSSHWSRSAAFCFPAASSLRFTHLLTLTAGDWPQKDITTLKSRKPEKKLQFPHCAGQIRTRV